MQGGGMILPTDIHSHWFYNRGEGAELLVGHQVIPLLNLDVVKGKGRPKGAKGKKNSLLSGVTIVTGPGVEYYE